MRTHKRKKRILVLSLKKPSITIKAKNLAATKKEKRKNKTNIKEKQFSLKKKERKKNTQFGTN